MLGAIVGDIVGSPYEFYPDNIKTPEFPLFSEESNWTDDTLMTLAVGQALLDADGDESKADAALIDRMREFANTYRLPKGGFGAKFAAWLGSRDPNPKPYGSFGNGSAMRVSSVAWLFNTLEEVEHWAEITARVTHDHPEGIKGAQATAAAIFLARKNGPSPEAKAELREYIERRFGYDLSRTIAEIRPGYRHVETCQESIPEAITAYLESDSFENAIRLAVSLGGDADTQAAIAGSIAEAAYGIPDEIDCQARKKLPESLCEVLENVRNAGGFGYPSTGGSDITYLRAYFNELRNDPRADKEFNPTFWEILEGLVVWYERRELYTYSPARAKMIMCGELFPRAQVRASSEVA